MFYTVLIIFYKPFGVLCQFTGKGLTLNEYINVPGIYPAGRLYKYSEGLLVLTDDGRLQDRLVHPKYGKHKIYWIQVDRAIDAATFQRLEQDIHLKDGPAHAILRHRIGPPPLPDREPPVRVRKHIPTSWIEMTINKGRNRQVR